MIPIQEALPVQVHDESAAEASTNLYPQRFDGVWWCLPCAYRYK